MRLPNATHRSRPWRIHEVIGDFRLVDVWELPVTFHPQDFGRLVDLLASYDPSRSSSRVVRALFSVRSTLGRMLALDGPRTGLGARVPSLRERLPGDLRDACRGPAFEAMPFTSLFLLHDEWAAEVANRTVHGVMHVSRIPAGNRWARAHLAVYVKPNGPTGAAYLAVIRPFRHLLVYPAMMRELARMWQGTGVSGRRA